jgi:hypothetical protein
VSIGTRDGMAHGAPGMQEMPRYFRALQLQRSISRMSLDAAGLRSSAGARPFAPWTRLDVAGPDTSARARGRAQGARS